MLRFHDLVLKKLVQQRLNDISYIPNFHNLAATDPVHSLGAINHVFHLYIR